MHKIFLALSKHLPVKADILNKLWASETLHANTRVPKPSPIKK